MINVSYKIIDSRLIIGFIDDILNPKQIPEAIIEDMKR